MTQFPKWARWLRLLLLVNTVLLLVGLVSPIITLEKFYIVENTFSVLTGVIQLAEDGLWFLVVIVTGFSILLPFLKLRLLYQFVSVRSRNHNALDRYLHWVHVYGKWSMLDVFVVAILVVSVKLGAIVNVQMRYGLYAFTAAVLLTMVITAVVVHLANTVNPPEIKK
ncbi:MAG TPA: paraquat-inducible protein A [Acidiferrobacteraceae bacterium]|mgnify:CR=1 FL=1|nr:paraquat-inducible protein A [Acidiferrobacteraceae bacterium]